MARLRRVVRAIREAIDLLNLPFDVQTLWNFFRRWIWPPLSGLISAAVVIVIGYLRDAPFWQVAVFAILAFAVIYVLVFILVWALRRSRPASTSPPEALRASGTSAAYERENAEMRSAVGVYREAVRETHRDPLQVEEETYEEFLRRRCQELAQRLFSFLEEQGYSRYEDPNDPEIERRDDMALTLYNRGSLGPETRNLLRKLEERGLYRPEMLKSFERQAVAKPLSLFAVERIANLLNEIGHDW